MANVCTLGSASMRDRYALDDCYDPNGDAAAHMPYTKAGYAAVATAVVRALHGLLRSPFKVIALDCDNTLWKGICGEDGVLGIELTPHHLALQSFMVDRMKAGMLLCLCSRNNERDVMEVFERRSEMRLAREHLVATRINWDSKSRNIESLAQELGLGLDSFIFVDDSPFDCAEVRTQCPRVLTLQLPSDDRAIGPFLDHVWAFDARRSTDEDGNRTRMYRETAQRERYREQAFSLKDYIEGLKLHVEIGDVTDEQLARVSQLTFRTNQFNFTTRRRSESEIRQFLGRPQAHCLVVRVTDRFGDYGIVGVVMYDAESDRCRVDTLLLSCRVLGRGVEHAVLAALARRTMGDGQGIVDVECVPSERNAPALAFVAGIGDRYRSDETSWSFPAEYLAGLRYEPEKAAATAAAHADPPEAAPPRRAALAFDFADNAERLQRVAETLGDAGALATRIDEHRMSRQASQIRSDEPTSSTLEAKIRSIWRKVLGAPGIGLDDNFFDAGGTSLRAVQVLAMIKQELKQTLSIVSLFECPTVRLLAARMGAGARDEPGDAAIAAATRRGQNRRYNVSRPRVP
jgi:FkbH-like protein